MKSKYIHEENVHNTDAASIIVPFVINLLNPKSIADIGCGLGTWLKVFQNYNVKDVIGIDGNHLNKNQLVIDKDLVLLKDLELPFTLERKFDLAMSLEVAEHLKESSAKNFVSSITKLSDVILFSAAITKQGGQNHINEQLPTYWSNLFALEGFTFIDVVRHNFWNNPKVDIWYKQNIFLIVKNEKLEDFNNITRFNQLDIIHPDLYISKLQQIEEGRMGLSFPIKVLTKTLIRGFKKLF